VEERVYRTIEDFLAHWKEESAGFSELLAVLTDESLDQPVADGHRTLGRIAWHLVTTVPEMMSKTGLGIRSVAEDAPLVASAGEIAEAYERVAIDLDDAIRTSWKDADLAVEDEMYGSRWTRSYTLKCLVEHQIHHAGQMTVLMRQAGLPVPGRYGPAKEDWAKHGMEPPAV
jgi:uncharacterized damage-inducible protein DinB